MSPEDEAVQRVISVLGQYVLIKRELHWYRTREPKVYEEMLSNLKVAISGDNRQA